MVEAGAKEVSEAQVVGALEAAHAAIKQIVAGIDDAAKGRRARRSSRSQRKEIDHDFYREVEEKMLGPLSDGDAHQRTSSRATASVDQVLADFVASLPEGERRSERSRRSTSSTS